MHTAPRLLAALTLTALSATALADPEHQGQVGVSTIATTGRPAAPVAAPQPIPGQPVAYTPPPPIGATGQPQQIYVPPPQQPMYVPPVTPPPPAQSQQQRNAEARPGFVGSVQGGATVPVQGDLGEFASTGGVGIIQGGWEIPGGLSLRVEVGYRTNSIEYTTNTGVNILDSESAIFYGAGARYTIARTAAVHPFLEVYADLFSPLVSTTSYGSSSSSSSATAGTGFSLGGGAGFEVDLNEQISLQLSARYDEVLSDANGNALTGGLTHVLVGGSYYY